MHRDFSIFDLEDFDPFFATIIIHIYYRLYIDNRELITHQNCVSQTVTHLFSIASDSLSLNCPFTRSPSFDRETFHDPHMSTILKAFPATTSNLARTIATAAVALRAYKETSYTAVMAKSRTRRVFLVARKHDLLLFPLLPPLSSLSPSGFICAVLLRDCFRRNLFLIYDAPARKRMIPFWGRIVI